MITLVLVLPFVFQVTTEDVKVVVLEGKAVA